MSRALRRLLPALALAVFLRPASAQFIEGKGAIETHAPAFAGGSAASLGSAAAPPGTILPLSAAPSVSAAPLAAPAAALEAAPLPAAAALAVPQLPVGSLRSSLPSASLPVGAASVAPALSAAAPAAFPTALSAAASGVERPASSAVEAAAKAGLVDAAVQFDGASARRALDEAAKGDYTVTVLQRRVGGTARLAVILGEKHLKSQKAADAGRAVLARFSNYALEGYDAQSTWARRFNWRLRTGERKELAKKNPVQYGQGSTIHAAARKVEDLRDARDYLLSLAPEKRERLLQHAARALAAGTPDAVTLTQGKTAIMDAAGIVRELMLLSAPEAARAPPVARRVSLEAGHRADLAENIAVWEPTVQRAVGAATSVSLLAVIASMFGGWPALFAVAWPGVLACGALLVYLILGDVVTKRWPRSPLGVLFPLDTGIVRARDRTMAANLAQAVQSAPDAAPWLAVVGKAHVAGMRKRLIERHGFKDAGLDSLTRG